MIAIVWLLVGCALTVLGVGMLIRASWGKPERSEFEIELERMTREIEALSVELATPLIPLLRDLARALNALIEQFPDLNVWIDAP